MKLKLLVLFFASIIGSASNAQNSFFKPEYLKVDIENSLKETILQSLDTLLSQIDRNKLNPELVDKDNFELSMSTFVLLKSDDGKNKRQLINAYPISLNEYLLVIANMEQNENKTAILKSVFSLVSKNSANKIVFSLPLNYLTRDWKTMVVGDVTYHFPYNLNVKNATSFNNRNTLIASKFGLKPEKLNFYISANYQEILNLLGLTYDIKSNGKYRDGYGGEANTIFSVMDNEDFSHDIFHFYSEKIRTNKRNCAAEEGYAYSWGNAYYTDQNGDMISQKQLVTALVKYVKENPNASLINLFDTNPYIFTSLPKEVSVKSTLSSLICDDVESKKGIEGVKALLNCGKGDDNYFKSVGSLIQINRTNFDAEVTKLLMNKKYNP
jgi:hypothetical protein